MNPASSATSTATDFYTLLASAVSAATSSNAATGSTTETRDLSNSGTLIPPTVHGEDRLSFITAQRERLSILLSALDKEANSLQNDAVKPSAPRSLPSMLFDGSTSSEEEMADRPKSAMSGLSTRRSEVDFERIDAESGTEEVENGRKQARRSQSGSGGSWMPWSWGTKAETSAPVDTVMTGTQKPGEKGMSSGVDA